MTRISKLPPAVRGDCAQLTYTSYDDGAGRGGWRIKQTTGEFSSAERDSVIERIPTVFDLEPRLPEFPTHEQIAARPVRLSYAYMSDGAGAYWHTVDAGRDASGRPGNVFAHVVLDRRAPDARSTPPIVRWRSADWLTPYGAGEVTDAVLPENALPQPNPEFDAKSSVKFLMDGETDRPGVFRVLIDAVADALAGGPSVVLLTDDHETSARWIATVSYFLPIQLAQTLSWTTHDSPDYAAIDIARGTHLISMSRTLCGDLEKMAGAMLIADDEEPDLGDIGSVHRVARGTVPVTRLSVLVEGVLADDEVAVRVLAGRDRAAADFEAPELSAIWPLAVAVHAEPELDEFHDDAFRTIAADAPDSAAAKPWAAELVTRAQMRFPLSISELLDKLIVARARGQDTAMIGCRFLDAALRDSEWMGSANIDDVPGVASVDIAAVRKPITALLDHIVAQSVNETTAAQLYRLAELVVRLGRRDAEFTKACDEILAHVRTVGVGFFWDRDRWPRGMSLHSFSGDTRARFVRPLIAESSLEQLDRLFPAAWSWLFGEPAMDSVALPANPTPADLYLYPVAVRTVLASHDIHMDPQTRREMVTAAVDFAIESKRFDDDQARRITGELVGLQSPEIDVMLHWTRQTPHRVGAALLRAPAFSASPDPRFFAEVLRGAGADGVAVDDDVYAAVILRQWLISQGSMRLERDELLRYVQACLAVPPRWIDVFADDLVIVVVAGFIAGQSVFAVWADPDTEIAVALHRRVLPIRNEVFSVVRSMVYQRLVDVDWLVARSFLWRLEPGRCPRTILDGDQPVSWSERIIDAMLSGGTYDGPATDAGLRDAAWGVVQRGSPADAEAFFRDYRRAARDWLREFRIDGTDSNWRVIRRSNREEPR